MEQWNYDDYNEYLSHHGIKGMHWGIRRYQRRDGSLTPKGERRRTLRDAIHDHKVKKKRKAALEKARATKQANKEAAEKARKEAEKRQKKLDKGKLSAKQMTDEELRYMTARKQMEKQYNQLDLETNVSKRFINNAWNNAVEPALLNAGKNVLQKYVERTVGDFLEFDKKKKSPLEIAKEEAELARYKKEKVQSMTETKKLLEGESDDDKAYNELKRKSEMTGYEKTIASNEAAIKKIKDGDPVDEEAKKWEREAKLRKNMKNAYNDARWLENEKEKDARKREESEGSSGSGSSGSGSGSGSSGSGSGSSGNSNSSGSGSGSSSGSSSGGSSGSGSGSSGSGSGSSGSGSSGSGSSGSGSSGSGSSGSGSSGSGSSGSEGKGSGAAPIFNSGYGNESASHIIGSSEAKRGNAWVENSATGEWLVNTFYREL